MFCVWVFWLEVVGEIVVVCVGVMWLEGVVWVVVVVGLFCCMVIGFSCFGFSCLFVIIRCVSFMILLVLVIGGWLKLRIKLRIVVIMKGVCCMFVVFESWVLDFSIKWWIVDWCDELGLICIYLLVLVFILLRIKGLFVLDFELWWLFCYCLVCVCCCVYFWWFWFFVCLIINCVIVSILCFGIWVICWIILSLFVLLSVCLKVFVCLCVVVFIDIGWVCEKLWIGWLGKCMFCNWYVVCFRVLFWVIVWMFNIRVMVWCMKCCWCLLWRCLGLMCVFIGFRL